MKLSKKKNSADHMISLYYRNNFYQALYKVVHLVFDISVTDYIKIKRQISSVTT